MDVAHAGHRVARRHLVAIDGRVRRDSARYGYAIEGGTEAGYRMLAALLRDSVRVWYQPGAFRSGTSRVGRGSFVARVVGNGPRVHALVRQHAAAIGAPVVALSGAGVDEGFDLGSNLVFPVREPKIAIIAGPGVSGQSAGYAWYALDQRLGYPSTILDPTAVSGAALDEFNVIVLPSVQSALFERMLGDGGRDRLTAWVRAGGTLVTLEAATAWVATERVGLSRLRVRRDSVRADSTAGAPLPAGVPGAIVRVVADTLSPLLAGIVEREFPAYIFSDRVFTFPRDVSAGESVLRYAPEARLRVAGYLWPEVPVAAGRLAVPLDGERGARPRHRVRRGSELPRHVARAVRAVRELRDARPQHVSYDRGLAERVSDVLDRMGRRGVQAEERVRWSRISRREIRVCHCMGGRFDREVPADRISGRAARAERRAVRARWGAANEHLGRRRRRTPSPTIPSSSNGSAAGCARSADREAPNGCAARKTPRSHRLRRSRTRDRCEASRDRLLAASGKRPERGIGNPRCRAARGPPRVNRAAA